MTNDMSKREGTDTEPSVKAQVHGVSSLIYKGYHTFDEALVAFETAEEQDNMEVLHTCRAQTQCKFVWLPRLSF